MNGLNEIKAKLGAQKAELREKYRVKEIGIFGSYARKTEKKTSDLDVLVSFEKIPGLLKFLELENYLSDLLGLHVDLVRKEVIRKELRDNILKEAIPV